jgi:hypothetical protein
MATNDDDYDTPWKTALTRYFPEFMAFYFPQAHAAIDWAQPHVFLDQELAKLAGDGKLGRRLVDKLVRVGLRDGSEQWVLVHVEVQGRRERGFAERMFVYHYRIYDRYRRKVASLALVAADGHSQPPSAFGYELFGCEMRFRFPIVLLSDYSGRVAELEQDDNPFALVTLAWLQTRLTRGKAYRRRAAKWRLTKLLFRRDWDKQRIIDLYFVIDWMMRLPPELDRRLQQGIRKMERSEIMPYVSSIERYGRELGRKEGLQEGRQVGLQEGRQEGLAAALTRVLAHRFGPLDAAMRERLAQAKSDELERWLDHVLGATTLDEVFCSK